MNPTAGAKYNGWSRSRIGEAGHLWEHGAHLSLKGGRLTGAFYVYVMSLAGSTMLKMVDRPEMRARRLIQ